MLGSLVGLPRVRVQMEEDERKSPSSIATMWSTDCTVRSHLGRRAEYFAPEYRSLVLRCYDFPSRIPGRLFVSLPGPTLPCFAGAVGDNGQARASCRNRQAREWR